MVERLTSWDKSTHDGTALSRHFAWDSVWLSNVGAPVTPSDWEKREFGDDDGTSNSSCDFFGTFDTKPNVCVKVTNSHESLESSPLTGIGLFLNWCNGHDLVFESREKQVDDLVFFDWEREEVDFLHRLDLAVFHKSTKFGNRNPDIPSVSSASFFTA